MSQPQTLFDRILGQSRPLWVIVSISLVMLLLPFLAAYLDDMLDVMLVSGQWRVVVVPVIIIIYIWVISQPFAKMGAAVLAALRPLTRMDDESYQRLVEKSSFIPLNYELLTLGGGLALGAWLGLKGGFPSSWTWLHFYWIAANSLMWGLLAWTVLISLASTRVTVAIHRQLVEIDLFDLAPFEPIGRQSLLLALVFIGGVTIGLILSFDVASLSSPYFWLIYIPMAIVPVLVFFLNMRPTHRVLSTEKNRQLQAIQALLQSRGSALIDFLEQDKETGSLSSEVEALIAFEQRVKEARTWPYNTPMLRSLFFSVLIPLVTVLARLGIELMF